MCFRAVAGGDVKPERLRRSGQPGRRRGVGDDLVPAGANGSAPVEAAGESKGVMAGGQRAAQRAGADVEHAWAVPRVGGGARCTATVGVAAGCEADEREPYGSVSPDPERERRAGTEAPAPTG